MPNAEKGVNMSDKQEVEEWKLIPDFPGYFVSDLGRVKHNSYVLKPYKTGRNNCQYLTVKLYFRDVFNDTVGINKSIHQLVLEAFIGSRPLHCEEANHKDGDTLNNLPSNLEWCTTKCNKKHAVNQLGIWLKPGEVWLIRKLLSAKIKQRIIACIFKVDQSTISKINIGAHYA